MNQPEFSPAGRGGPGRKARHRPGRPGARVEILDGEDPVDAILEFAKSHGITQLFIGHSQRSGLWQRIWGNPVDKLIRGTPGMDVRVFPQ